MAHAADPAPAPPAAPASGTVIWDVLALLGSAVIIIGIAMMHVPSACIVGGLFILCAALLGARRG